MKFNLFSSRMTEASRHEKSASVPTFDVGGITATIQRALASAGLDTRSAPIEGLTHTIRQALSGATPQRPAASSPQGMNFDGVFRPIAMPDLGIHSPHFGSAPPAAQSWPGEFLSRSFTNQAGTRTYKLYIPTSYSDGSGDPVPLVVMLHGCTQSPDDFAAGTRMNELAEKHAFLVAYPAQTPNANGSKCWNWFRAEDQIRDRGEPSLIAGITREVASTYRVDDRRIFVAGLSAGAAMAVTLGATYPELYAGVGAHSGLPYAAARDMPSAFAAMKGAAAAPCVPCGEAAQNPHRPRSARSVPTIVFHGDADHTVDPRNGAAIVEQAIAEQATMSGAAATPLRASVRPSASPDGRTFIRTVYSDIDNQAVVEQWVLHGAGHAWSGGSPRGSYTDARGPDASAEMVRFFYALHPAARPVDPDLEADSSATPGQQWSAPHEAQLQ